MKLVDITIEDVRTLVTSIVGVAVLFAGLKSPLSPTDITAGCSLLGLEPAMRTKPPRDEEGE